MQKGSGEKSPDPFCVKSDLPAGCLAAGEQQHHERDHHGDDGRRERGDRRVVQVRTRGAAAGAAAFVNRPGARRADEMLTRHSAYLRSPSSHAWLVVAIAQCPSPSAITRVLADFGVFIGTITAGLASQERAGCPASGPIALRLGFVMMR